MRVAPFVRTNDMDEGNVPNMLKYITIGCEMNVFFMYLAEGKEIIWKTARCLLIDTMRFLAYD